MKKIFYKLVCILTGFNAGYQHLSEKAHIAIQRKSAILHQYE